MLQLELRWPVRFGPTTSGPVSGTWPAEALVGLRPSWFIWRLDERFPFGGCGCGRKV